MRLYNTVANTMLTNIASLIGANGSIDFFTTSGDIPTTGLLNQSSRVKMSSTPISNVLTDGSNPSTQSTGAFGPLSTGTAARTGIAAFFAILNTNAGAVTDITEHVLFTGSVATQAADMNFNTNSWDAGDNIVISGLNFIQPQ